MPRHSACLDVVANELSIHAHLTGDFGIGATPKVQIVNCFTDWILHAPSIAKMFGQCLTKDFGHETILAHNNEDMQMNEDHHYNRLEQEHNDPAPRLFGGVHHEHKGPSILEQMEEMQQLLRANGVLIEMLKNEAAFLHLAVLQRDARIKELEGV